MNRLDNATRSRVIAALCEGNSIRSVVRMTGVAKGTVTKLLLEIGAACAEFQNEALRDLPCKKVQCDEIWSFCYAKDKNVPAARSGEFGVGSVWTWTAIDADTKLICSWVVGRRDAEAAFEFMTDLADRLRHRVQLTTDGYKSYLEAVDYAFGGNIDYAMLVKMYGAERAEEARYSPAECLGARVEVISGKPNRKHVSTSYVERQNLTMRMHMRYFAPDNDDDRNPMRKMASAERDEIRSELYRIICNNKELVSLACVACIQSAYAMPSINNRDDLYEGTYKPVSERFQYYLQDAKKRGGPQELGMVVCDHRGLQDDKRLKQHHEKLLHTSSGFVSEYRNMVEGLFLQSSNLSVGIQLADIIAGAVWRYYEKSDEKWFKMAEPSFRRDIRGIVDGYGIVKYPKGTWRKKGDAG